MRKPIRLTLTVMLMSIFACGCGKNPLLSSLPEAVHNSNGGGCGEIGYVTPPLVFENEPLNTALQKIFSNALTSFVPDLPLTGYVVVTLNVSQKTGLETVLSGILNSRGLFFYKSGEVYHISEGEKGYITPPFSLTDEPLNTALTKIFLNAHTTFVSDISLAGYGNLTMMIIQKTDLDSVLSLVLSARGLTYYKIGEVYHIKS